MENLLKDLSSLTKLLNDSKIQLKAISILNEILETLKKLDNKKLKEVQQHLEDALYNYIFQSRANSDICNRYIYYIYKHLFDFGLNSRLNEFIIKYSSLVSSNKSSHNVKGTALWLLGKVCCKSNYKSPHLIDLINLLIKNIKNTSENLIRNECFATMSKLLELKLPNFYNSINDIMKIIFKQEKYYSTFENKCKKNILKTLNSTLFYLNQNSLQFQYEGIVNFLVKGFEDEEPIVRDLATKIYVDLHVEKVFEPNINLQKIMRKKPNEQLKNFFEVILYLGNIFSTKSEISLNIKISYIQIIKILIQKNMEYINSSENLICKIFDLLISFFQIAYVGFITNNSINLQKNLINMNNFSSQTSLSQVLLLHNHQNKLTLEVEELYRNYVKSIYHSSYRKTLLKHVLKRLSESQTDLDKMENSSSYLQSGVGQSPNSDGSGLDKLSDKSSTSTNSSHKKTKKEGKDTNEAKKETKEREKYTEYHVNAMLLTLIEFTENNFDLFEITFKSFNDISNFLLVYLISSVKSFRVLINRVLVNLAYFIPAWRIQILTLVLNFTSVAHAEVAALKNTFIYLIDETNSEYKYALIIRNNLDLLKDVSNCLAMILSSFSHKYHGITVDMSNAALNIAKNMIIGKFADEEDNPKSLSIKEKTNKFNYSNSDVDAHKEAGWIIIQGICHMDYTWLTNNFKSLFQLWKYIFSEHACELDESELSKAEFREALISEFFIKKAALASLRNFIIASFDFSNSQSFNLLIPKFMANALQFFIPFEKKKILSFYKNVLKEFYKEAKSYLYDCFNSIQTKLYNTKFNNLLYPICDDLTAGDYMEYSYEYIFSNLNFIDTFMCETGKEKETNSLVPNTNNHFRAENFNSERYNLSLSNKINHEYNSKLVNSGVNLLVEILLDNNLNMKNRQSIFKHFLTHMSELSMKQLDKFKSIKAVNIVYCLFLILKRSAKRNVYIVMDESIFASAKMILDIGFKMDIALIRRIAAEGQGYLLKVSTNPQYNINYYLTALECKFKNEINIDNDQFINTFYMIANIFRVNEFSNISPILDLYMNFIISYFNKIEDLYNPYICQSIYIITEILIKNNEIDHARKLIEVYKMNYLFINKDNNVFFKEIVERNSMAEIRLLILLVILGENLKSNEIELFKLILNKFMLDEKYTSNKIKRNFLFFSKILLNENKKLKELVHNSQFLHFLMKNVVDSENINLFISNSHSLLNLNLRSDAKISLEILIIYIMSIDLKNVEIFKEFSEKLVNTLNEICNSNRNFYYNNSILNTVSKLPSNEDLLFNKNSENLLQQISSFLDLENKNFEKQNFIFFDMVYGNFHLIKLSKIFLKIYFEKKYNQYTLIFNLLKDIIQNQLTLHSTNTNKISTTNQVKSDSLTNSQENKEEKSKSLLNIRKLTKSLHISVKKFLIKSLKHCLHLTLNNLNTENLSNISNQHSSVFIEFLNQFMGLSMILISCEECWQIKIKGVQLLKEIITKFAKLKDNRTDDDSLLIQQYEAQISSCLKTILNNSYSIFALFKGLKMLYLHLAVPITTDNSYVKKVNLLVDSNIKLVLNANMPTFSEKFDHLLICKKLNFFSKLYMTTIASSLLKGKSNVRNNPNSANSNMINSLTHLKTFDVFNSKIFTRENFYENLIKTDAVDNFVEFFNSKMDLFYINIFNMLNDFYVILTQEKKFIKNYKNFVFISTGNRISFSQHKVLKYSQIYLKILSMLVNDNRFINEEFKENYKLLIKQPNTNHSYDNIIHLIFYFLNHFFLKKLHSDEYMNNEFMIYSESDVSEELKEKIVINNLLTLELTEIMYKILNNSVEIVKISKKVNFEVLKQTINLFSLSIYELDVNLMNILDCLLNKWFNNNNVNKEDNLTQEENLFLIENVTKLVYFYHNKKSYKNTKYESLLTMKLIEISSLISMNILNMSLNCNNQVLIKKLDNMLILLFNILLNIFQTTQDMAISKLSAAKIFPLLTKINNTERIQLILPLIKDCLMTIYQGQFEKFFLLFYMILQFLTKIQNCSTEDKIINNEIYELTTNFFINEIIVESINNKEFLNIIFKSLMLGISQNFDITVKSILENILFYLLQSGNLLNYITYSDDLQNLVLTYIISTEDKEKRRNLIHLVILELNDNYTTINFEIWKLAVYSLKLLSKDLEYLREIASELDLNLLANLDNLIKMQQLQAQKQAETIAAAANTQSKPVINYQSGNGISNKNITGNNTTHISQGNNSTEKFTTNGPKLKALKFGK